MARTRSPGALWPVAALAAGLLTACGGGGSQVTAPSISMATNQAVGQDTTVGAVASQTNAAAASFTQAVDTAFTTSAEAMPVAINGRTFLADADTDPDAFASFLQ